MKILIVDDSKTMRMIIQRTLKRCNIGSFTACEAATGVEGLQKAKEFQPDIILSDWNMPEMNGLEMLKALREEGNEVRLGFVTTECTEEVRQIADEAGASFFITKPFTPEKLEFEFEALQVK